MTRAKTNKQLLEIIPKIADRLNKKESVADLLSSDFFISINIGHAHDIFIYRKGKTKLNLIARFDKRDVSSKYNFFKK
jgi:hypothetical protein